MTWLMVVLIGVILCTRVRHVGVSAGIIVLSAIVAAASLLCYRLPVEQPWEIAEVGSAIVGILLILLAVIRMVELLFPKPRPQDRRRLFRVAVVSLALLLPFQIDASWGVGFFSL